jgi:hypothetical protein
LKHTFSYATRRALSKDDEQKKQTSGKIFSYGYITYAINTLKIDYLHLGKLTAANILTLLVWRRGLSIDAKKFGKLNYQYKHLHCKGIETNK